MATPSNRSLTTFVLSLAAFVSLVQARTTTSTKKPFTLELSPIHAAIFAFYIIFGLITAFQALSAVGNLGRRTKLLPSGRPDFSTGVLYPYPIFLATASLLAFYVVSTVWIVYNLNDAPGQIKLLPDAFFAGRNVTDQLSDFFLLTALAGLLYYRQRLSFKADPLRVYTYKLVLDGVLLTAMLIIIIVYACLTASYSSSRDLVQAGLALLALDRVYIALNIILALDIAASSTWTWIKLKHESHPDAVILGQLVKIVSPLLILRAAFRLFSYVVQTKPTFTVHDLDSVRLAHILIMGFAYFIVLWFSLS